MGQTYAGSKISNLSGGIKAVRANAVAVQITNHNITSKNMKMRKPQNAASAKE